MAEEKVVTIGKSEVLKHTSAAKVNPKSGEPHANNLKIRSGYLTSCSTHVSLKHL